MSRSAAATRAKTEWFATDLVMHIPMMMLIAWLGFDYVEPVAIPMDAVERPLPQISVVIGQTFKIRRSGSAISPAVPSTTSPSQ
jgi:hypothetical protein